jgi:hypothetical protein
LTTRGWLALGVPVAWAIGSSHFPAAAPAAAAGRLALQGQAVAYFT